MQRFYEKNVEGMLYGMGIGSGEAVSSSGEEAVFPMLRRLIEPPFCIFDVGANQGQFLEACLQSLAGADCQIHSFEPVNATFEQLRQKFGHRQGVKLNPVALGYREETRPIFFNSRATGLASLSKRDLDHFGIPVDASELATVQTIDGYCGKNNIARINFLKIDVEGHELDVLKGASNLLAAKAIDLITFEFGGTHIDTRIFFRDYWHLLTGYDFRIFRITPTGYLAEITRYRETLEVFLTTNFFAARKPLAF